MTKREGGKLIILSDWNSFDVAIAKSFITFAVHAVILTKFILYF
jgi:hypothetical protein